MNGSCVNALQKKSLTLSRGNTLAFGRQASGLEQLRLHRRAQSDHLLRIEFHMWTPSHQLLHHAPHQRDVSRAARQHHFVDLSRIKPCILQRRSHWTDHALENRLHQALELGPADLPYVKAAVRQRNLQPERGPRWKAHVLPA